jgi:hypothetical protein
MRPRALLLDKHTDYNIATAAGSPHLCRHFSRYTDDAPGMTYREEAGLGDRTSFHDLIAKLA